MEYNQFMEALKGKQKKLDKNHNGELDAQDFKILRKEDTEENNESFDFNRAAISKQKLQNLKSSGRKVRGASIANLMRASGLREEELDETELDHLDEVLSKDAKAGDWIHDFVHSTNPKFEGKSKKERMRMALGAYYGKQNEQAPVAPVPDRKYIKGTPENKALKDSRKPINGHPTNVKEEAEQIDERSDQAKQNKTMKNLMTASKGAQVNRTLKLDPADYGYKKAQHLNKAIGRQMMKTEATDTVVKDKTGKVISFKHEGDWKKATKADVKKDPAGKVANMAGQAMQKMKNMAEAKDEQEYGYEGDMALNQLKTLVRCAEMIEDMLKPDTDLPEWVQSKITLATDYIQTAADYMYSEMNEGTQYAGLEKEDKPGKIKTAVVKLHPKGVSSETVEGWKDAKKPVKESFDDEGNLISTKISYKDFITEIKLADLPVRKIQGHSYGANYSDPEGADDYDDKKPMKPAAEKRGRGRPAGAKSGARKITGTSKLMNK